MESSDVASILDVLDGDSWAAEKAAELAEDEAEDLTADADEDDDSDDEYGEDDVDDDGEGEFFATPIIYGSPSPNMYSRDELYTTRQAKRFLRVTRATLYSDAFRDLLSAFQVGGCENRQIWWPKHRVNAFLEAQK